MMAKCNPLHDINIISYYSGLLLLDIISRFVYKQ